MTLREFRKEITNMKHGEKVYINSIGLNGACIAWLREYIANGILTPDIDELHKCIKPEYLHYYTSGVSIFPQMTYVRSECEVCFG